MTSKKRSKMDEFGAKFLELKEWERRLTPQDMQTAKELSYRKIVDYIQNFMDDDEKQKLEISMLENWYLKQKVEETKGIMKLAKIEDYNGLVKYYKKNANLDIE